MMPTEVLRALYDRVGTKKFGCYVNPTSTGTLRILVRLEAWKAVPFEYVDLIPRDGDFVVKECQAWRLTCCKHALEHDWNYWRSCLTESGGRPTIEKYRYEKSEETLVDVLTEKVNKRLGDCP